MKDRKIRKEKGMNKQRKKGNTKGSKEIRQERREMDERIH